MHSHMRNFFLPPSSDRDLSWDLDLGAGVWTFGAGIYGVVAGIWASKLGFESVEGGSTEKKEKKQKEKEKISHK